MIDSNRHMRRLLFHSCVILAVTVLGGLVVWKDRPLIMPVALGFLAAYICRPLKRLFKYPWLPNGFRIAFLFTLSCSCLFFGTRLIKGSLPSEKEKLEILVRLKYQLNEKFDRFMEIDSVSGKGNALYNLVSRDLEPLRKSLNEYLELSPKQSAEFLDFCGKPLGPDKISEKYYQFYLANIKGMQTSDGGRWDDDWDFGKTNNKKEDHSTFLKLLIHTLTTWFLFPVVFIFFFLDKGEIKKFFIRLVPNRYFELSLAVFEEVNTAIGKYLRGLALQSLLVGLAMAIGLRLVGIPMQMAFLIGTLCGLLTVVPFFGPLMALSFGLCYSIIAETIFPLLPFVTLENFTAAVIGVNIAVAILQSFVIQPIVLGGNVSLHPLAVILGVSSASLIFGMTAVLLAIPLIVVIKVIVQHIFRGLRDYRII